MLGACIGQIGFTWLKTVSSEGRIRTFGFHKRRGISWQAGWLL